jgi:ATP-dependent DNA helicase RecG
MGSLRLDSPLQYLKGIGPARAQWFADAGLTTVGQLLEYYPFRYESEAGDVAIADLRPGMNATVRGTVVRLRGAGRATRVAEIDDGTDQCVLRWFQPRYQPRGLAIGAAVIAAGTAQEYAGRLEIVHPRVQVFASDAFTLRQDSGARQVGVYRGNAQLKPALIRRAVHTVLAEPRLPVEEPLPPALLRKHNLPSRAAAIRELHLPTNPAELTRARKRLVYEEFLLLEVGLALRRYRTLSSAAGQRLHVTPEIDRRIRARFPFPLTAGQDRAVREICADLESGRPMARLLQGDVGTGKTVVALYAGLVAIANGRQAAVMAPTEILARQHFNNIAHYLAGSRVRYALLRGGLGQAERAALLEGVREGGIDLVVGTQALIQKDVVFHKLAVVVVDEQHKFGVLQRAAFRTKGPMPHYLVMTATPIPRTLAMTVFGDLDVSVIRDAPPGRGRITTHVVAGRQWQTLMRELRPRLAAAEQAYVVCPVIGNDAGPTDDTATSSDKVSVLSAVETHQRLAGGPWAGLDVGLLHGGMSSDEQRRILAAFAAGELHALVATTVVEVGVDVPNATVMVVEHAERFGLSQLHQLRGRVGRGSADALCVLVVRGGGRVAADRLAVMTETTDGFRIAEADLRQRGPGELLGTRQHGLPELRIGNLVEDFELLETARADAFELVRQDPALSRPEHAVLADALRRQMGDKLALVDAG